MSPRAFADAQPRGRTAAHDRADEAPKSLKVEVRLNPAIFFDKANVRMSRNSCFELCLQARVDRFAEPGQYAASNHLMAGESLINVSHKVWLTKNARYASWNWVTALISDLSDQNAQLCRCFLPADGQSSVFRRTRSCGDNIWLLLSLTLFIIIKLHYIAAVINQVKQYITYCWNRFCKLV